jgi:hypothetical protein
VRKGQTLKQKNIPVLCKKRKDEEKFFKYNYCKFFLPIVFILYTCEDASQGEAANGVNGLFGEFEKASPAGEIPQEPVHEAGHNVSTAHYCHQVGRFHHTQALHHQPRLKG